MPIHTIAFSPTDERGPLLNLGEVSKRSNGTFRWAKTADDLRAQIDTLTDELNKQYVLTYKIDARSLEGRKLRAVVRGPDVERARLRFVGRRVRLRAGDAAADCRGGCGRSPALVVFGGGGGDRRGAGRPKKQMKFSPYKNARRRRPRSSRSSRRSQRAAAAAAAAAPVVRRRRRAGS